MADTRTFGDLIARIASEYATDDLLNDSSFLNVASIANYIRDAVFYYQRDNFFQGETIATVPTVAGTQLYDLPDDFVSMLQLDVIQNNTVLTLKQELYQDIDTMDAVSNAPTRGVPTSWAIYNSQVRLFPTPDQNNYTLRFIYQARPPEPVEDSDTNFWTTTAEELVRYRAKWLIDMAVFRDTEMAQMDKALELEAFRKVIVDTHGRLATGTLKATRF